MVVYNVIFDCFMNFDVCDILNVNGGSVGDNLSDYFGVWVNVNIFFLKKFVKFNKQFVMDVDVWWKVDNGNFGIIFFLIGFFLVVGFFMFFWLWDFFGGSGSLLRILDYVGYNFKVLYLFLMYLDFGLYFNL